MRPLHKFVSMWLPITSGAFLMLSEMLLADFPRFVIISGVSLALITVGIWQALSLLAIQKKTAFFFASRRDRRLSPTRASAQ